MKIKIYVDWKGEEVLSEKDYKEFKDQKTKEIADYYFEDNYGFSEYLSNGDYDPARVFQMTDEEKEKVKAEWKAHCEEYAKENFADEYDYEEIELEV